MSDDNHLNLKQLVVGLRAEKYVLTRGSLKLFFLNILRAKSKFKHGPGDTCSRDPTNGALHLIELPYFGQGIRTESRGSHLVMEIPHDRLLYFRCLAEL